MRTAEVTRKTNETDVRVSINLDGTGKHDIRTGIGFLDHMLDQLARHSLMDITIRTDGDLHIDGHHTAEDTALALGEAFTKALGDRTGITRYGHAHAPMDETLTRAVVDISGRPYLVWHVAFSQPKLGELDTEMIREIFQAFAQQAGLNLHIEMLYGTNNHHISESVFKAVARALRMAIETDPRQKGMVPSTKGTIGGQAA